MKVAETYYLPIYIKITNTSADLLVIKSLISAFVSSSGNITFAMQYVLKGEPGF